MRPLTVGIRASTSTPVAPSRRDSASPLDRSVQYLRGVGPQRAQLLAELGIQTLGQLIAWFPFRHEEQGRPQAIDTLVIDAPATVIARVESVRGGGGYGGSRQPSINALVRDSTGRMRVTWFNVPYLRERLARGQVLRLFGDVGEHENLAQMVNPRVEWLDEDADLREFDRPRMVPIYRASAELTSGQIARMVETALEEALPAVQEILPAWLLRERQLPPLRQAIARMHTPASMDELATARRRLAYDELYLMQVAISLQRRFTAQRARAPHLPGSPTVDERIRRRFPFPLTAAQDRVIAEISADLARERPMTRLLQGDVGSGKTVVALYAALQTVANRYQAAILAPTEVLAAQHAASIEKYLAGSRVNRCLLTGKTPAAQRQPLLRGIADGSVNLIVGTQALLEQKVRFHSLGLVIVDEQHKFGVSQRATLRGKPKEARQRQQDSTLSTQHSALLLPHYLVMTATPIPRTLSMTVFGDLDVSVIDALPPGRQPVLTRIVGPAEEPPAWLEVRRRIAAGEQAYIVYPLVEESEALEVKAATAELEHVRRELLPGARVGLVHGRMRPADKQTAMREFVRGKLDALVCTTVIEVGVDVPNATVMAVQHAERYGLSALHQLRGRVGRGTRPSICLLLTDRQGELARERLGVLCRTNDGFRIAEEDLRLRGPGELLGTRQHGWPEFQVANPVADIELLMIARDDAARLVREDAALQRPEHAPLRAELRRRFREKVAFIDIA